MIKFVHRNNCVHTYMTKQMFYNFIHYLLILYHTLDDFGKLNNEKVAIFNFINAKFLILPWQ